MIYMYCIYGIRYVNNECEKRIDIIRQLCVKNSDERRSDYSPLENMNRIFALALGVERKNVFTWKNRYEMFRPVK